MITRRRSAIAFQACLLLLACSCGPTKTDESSDPKGNTASTSNAGSGQASINASSALIDGSFSIGGVSLRPIDRVGDEIRTRRYIRVSETLEDRISIAEAREVYLQEVKRVLADRAIEVIRDYEVARAAQWMAGDAENAIPQPTKLEGARVRLAQAGNGVARELLLGDAPPQSLSPLQIDSFDRALIPLRRLSPGDWWRINVMKVEGLATLLKGFGLDPSKSILRARLFELDQNEARISLEWSTNAIVAGTPVTFQLNGVLTFDRELQLISSLNITGGKRTRGGGTLQQIEMTITRERPVAWYD